MVTLGQYAKDLKIKKNIFPEVDLYGLRSYMPMIIRIECALT